MKNRFAREFLFLCLSGMLLSTATGDTIRERAENHFAVTGWSVNTDIFTSHDRNPVSIPGGNETFAAMTPIGDGGLVSLYPEISDLGTLDYSGIDNGLIEVLGKIAKQAGDRKIDETVCDPERNYLSPVTTYRLAKLPVIQSVWHSRPILEGPDVNGQMKATAVLRLLCADKGTGTELLATVSLSGSSGRWFLENIVFDGKVYAKLAQQD
jgi:hypothetical protein